MSTFCRNIIIAFGAIMIMSCSGYDFDQEQFKNEINLLSNSQSIYDKQVATIRDEMDDTIYIVAGLSGTLPHEKDLEVTIVEADSLFDSYNKSNFDIDSSRFAKILPDHCFEIPQLSTKIKAGEFKAFFPVYLRNLGSLSPDTLYFINYKIDPERSDAFNEEKQEVLLQIFMKNDYATTQSNTFYNFNSSFITTLGDDSAVPRRPTSSVQVFPVGEHSVRMLAGDENMGEYRTALDRINDRSIVVTVKDKTPQNPAARFVKIESYKNLEIKQLPPDDIYDNTYLINAVTSPGGRINYYKEFRLHYQYRLSPTEPFKEVKGILRLEYNPNSDLL